MATIKRIGQFWNNGGGTPDWADTGVNQQRANVPNLSGDTGQYWWYRIGGRVGRNTSGSKRLRFYVTNTTTGPGSGGANSRVPNAVLKHTEEISTSAVFTGSNGGEWRWADFDTPFLGSINNGYALGIASRDSGTSVGMIQAANPAMSGADNTWFYDRATNSSGIPQPGYSSYVNAGHLAVAMEGVKNEPPNRPGAITITAGGTTQTPTFKASFSDPNETVNGSPWDRLETYRDEIWWGGVRRSNTVYTATTAERNGRYSERQAAISIPYDTPYTYIRFHRDRAGAESLSRTFSGTIASGAAFDTPSAPTGFVTNLANPGGIVAVYRNPGGLNANAVQVRLVNSAGSPIQTSSILARTVTPNASTTVTWAQSGFGTQPAGVDRGVQIRARGTNNVWGQWSGTVWFTTNSAPNIALASPQNNHLTSTFPTLAATVSDPNSEHPPSSLSTQFRIYRDATLVGTYAGTYAGGNTFTLPPGAHSSSYGTYTWQARAYDGFLYSDWSNLRTLTYAAVPTVTITGPTSPVSTISPVLAWTSSNQTHWRVRAYDDDRLVYDTGIQAGNDQSHTITSEMYWIGGERWNNDETFDWVVSVRDASTLWGDSSPLTLTLEFPPIDPLIIDGSAMAYPGIAGTQYLHVNTSVSTYPEGDFLGYRRRRVAITGFQGSEIAGTETPLPTDTSAGNTAFTDYHVVSNQWYRYYVWQEVRVGNDTVASDPVSIDLCASWHGVVLFSNADPSQAVWLKYSGPDGTFEPSVSETLTRRNVLLRGQRAPLAIVSGHRTVNVSGEHSFVDREGMSAIQQLDSLQDIQDWQHKELSPNGRPNGACWRSGRGGKRGLYYVHVDVDSNPHHTIEVVNLHMEEYAFDPYREVI